MPQTIFAIRHAESSGQGAEAGLTEKGHQQAAALAKALRSLGIKTLYSSPYRRAQQTIAPFAKSIQSNVRIIDNLRERVLAPTPQPDWLDHIRKSFDDPDHALPGGEALSQTRQRAIRAVQTIAADRAPSPAFVSHGNLLASLLNGIDPSFGFDAWQEMKNPDLFEITLEGPNPIRFVRLPLAIQ